MEKRNTLLLTVIAVATLLVAVVGATFAYFATNINTANVVNITATTGGGGISFVTEKTDLTLNLAGQMDEVKKGNSVSNTATLTITGTNQGTVAAECYYSLALTDMNTGTGEVAYHPSDSTKIGTEKEFTLELSIKDGSSDAASLLAETQMNVLISAAGDIKAFTIDDYAATTYIVNSTSDVKAPLTGTTDPTNTAQVGKIKLAIPAGTSSSSATKVQVITATLTGYNTTWDQSVAGTTTGDQSFANRTFKYQLSVVQSSVYCGTAS